MWKFPWFPFRAKTKSPFASTIYDAASRAIASVEPVGNRTSYSYDPAGNQIAVRNPENDVATTVYDPVGKRLVVADHTGRYRQAKLEYDRKYLEKYLAAYKNYLEWYVKYGKAYFEQNEQQIQRLERDRILRGFSFDNCVTGRRASQSCVGPNLASSGKGFSLNLLAQPAPNPSDPPPPPLPIVTMDEKAPWPFVIDPETGEHIELPSDWELDKWYNGPGIVPKNLWELKQLREYDSYATSADPAERDYGIGAIEGIAVERGDFAAFNRKRQLKKYIENELRARRNLRFIIGLTGLLPVVGQLQDAATLLDPNASMLDKVLSTTSLGIDLLTLGLGGRAAKGGRVIESLGETGHLASKLNKADVALDEAAALQRISKELNEAPRGMHTGARSYVGVTEQQAEATYGWIRSLDADSNVATVARNTGLPDWYVSKIRQHVFFEKHLLPSIENPAKMVRRRFDANTDIATWWKLATEGGISKQHLDKVHRLFAHEYVERALMKGGLPYRQFNELGDAIYSGSSAHELAPLVGNVGAKDIVDPNFDVWKHVR